MKNTKKSSIMGLTADMIRNDKKLEKEIKKMVALLDEEDEKEKNYVYLEDYLKENKDAVESSRTTKKYNQLMITIKGTEINADNTNLYVYNKETDSISKMGLCARDYRKGVK